MAQKKKTAGFCFEQALTDLNSVVENMESGQLPLEESLSQFEKGIALIRQCQHALSQAEQKVQILTKDNNENSLKPFNEKHS